ncbi:hypothetical protein P40081_28610 [Paenibacillus sp. FSL P4-0081]|nr:hypothetical protein P40081_28610 [Paenibacillus sp. FSL P4-0081]
MYVWPYSELAKYQTIKTAFGDIRIRPDEYLSKGYSYIREDWGGGQIGFAWVCYPKTANIFENRKDQKHA